MNSNRGRRYDRRDERRGEVSARAMSAQAYATGNHVVLGGRAELHTVAHEAAHAKTDIRSLQRSKITD